MIRILGVDPGLAHTGWGFIEGHGNRLCHVEHGTIETSPDGDPAERVFKIFDVLRRLVEDRRPQLMGIEALYFARNRRSAIPVAEARGAIMAAAASLGVPVRSCTPLEIKKALTGHGRAEKFQVQEMVRLMLGLEEVPSPDHAADALAAAICSYHLYEFDRASSASKDPRSGTVRGERK
jgi:crossover junction endodeoxyribonuclease RuvC